MPYKNQYIAILFILSAGIVFYCCSSGTDAGSSSDLNPPYLIIPENGLKTSSIKPVFEFKHTNPDMDAIYYDFILSDSFSFSSIIYYQDNIIPSSDSFRICIDDPLEPGCEYYFKSAVHGMNNEDYNISAVYSIYIESIGDNIPNLYMCTGDSITAGYFPGQDYSDFLQELLKPYFGDTAQTVNQGIPGLNAWELKTLITNLLYTNHPAYTIILIGVNDLFHPGSCPEPFNCQTIQEIIDIAYSCRSFNSIPVVCTLIPVIGSNSGMYDSQVRSLNESLIDACKAHAIDIIDLYSAFEGYSGDMEDLYRDDVHPNVSGNQFIASVIFDYLSTRSMDISENPESCWDRSKAQKLKASDQAAIIFKSKISARPSAY